MNLGGGSHPNYFSCLNVFSVLDPWICQPVCLQNYDFMTVKVVKSSINVSNFSYKSCTLLWYAREEESFTRNNSVYFHKKKFPSLPNMGTQIRCAQSRYKTVQTDLKYPLRIELNWEPTYWNFLFTPFMMKSKEKYTAINLISHTFPIYSYKMQ